MTLGNTLPDVEIVLVRHAEPAWVVDGRQQDNPHLTRRGDEQAQLTANRLRLESFDEVHVSPLHRAQETAKPIDREKQTTSWLEEIRDPDWHGTPAEIVHKAFVDRRTMAAEDQWDGLDGGEDVRDFMARVHDGMAGFLAERGIVRLPGDLPLWKIERPFRRFLLVAHAAVNATLVNHLLGISSTPWEWERFVFNHSSITRLEAVPVSGVHTFCLTRLSEVEHLPTDLRTR